MVHRALCLQSYHCHGNSSRISTVSHISQSSTPWRCLSCLRIRPVLQTLSGTTSKNLLPKTGPRRNKRLPEQASSSVEQYRALKTDQHGTTSAVNNRVLSQGSQHLCFNSLLPRISVLKPRIPLFNMSVSPSAVQNERNPKQDLFKT